MKAATHPRQRERLAALARYHILDTPREADFDQIVELAAKVCDAPVAVVNFIDAERQWFKAEVGLGVNQTPLETSICSHVILEHEFTEIRDTLDDQRLCDNPLCFGDGGFRFYAGALLRTDDGLPLGTLCVLDTRSRALTELQRQTIQVLAAQVMKQLELRRALFQRDLLRREAYHRVTNSLTTVAALVRLQKNQSADPVLHDVLQAIENRIVSIAELHRELCECETAEQLELEPFVTRICGHLNNSLPPNVRIHVEVGRATLDSQQASSVALLLNEFIANSLKHAFPGNRPGTITIKGGVDREGQCFINCRDDGVGKGAARHHMPGSGLGTTIIKASAAQLGASYRTRAGDTGYRLELRFPLQRTDTVNPMDYAASVG